MPEGPELHLTMLSINKICKDLIFSGKIYRNPVHKCSDIEWDQSEYQLSAESRGKELRLFLQIVDSGDRSQGTGVSGRQRSARLTCQSKKATSILFTFGMSGKFAYTPAQNLHKHSHLVFFTKSEPQMALSFVDPRRFGRWVEGGQWSPDRGPCVIQEFSSFVKNIVNNLKQTDFHKPICELLLNQKYFSGIGNYLRAEILFRCQIPPFVRASSVLQLREGAEPPTSCSESSGSVTEGNTKTKSERRSKERQDLVKNESKSAVYSQYFVNSEVMSKHDYTCDPTFDLLTAQAQDLLKFCHTIPLEVVHLGSSKYSVLNLATNGEDTTFDDWLKCYNKAGMTNLADHNKRTMWFSGPAGPMVPPGANHHKSTKVERKRKKKQTAPESSQVTESTSLTSSASRQVDDV